jgi:hypothetical protein
MRLPDGFSVRPPRPQDAEGLVEMLNDESEALIGARIADTDWLASAWGDPAARDDDFGVVTDAGDRIAGYLMVQSDPPYTEVLAIGAVGLPYQGRGLGPRSSRRPSGARGDFSSSRHGPSEWSSTPGPWPGNRGSARC